MARPRLFKLVLLATVALASLVPSATFAASPAPTMAPELLAPKIPGLPVGAKSRALPRATLLEDFTLDEQTYLAGGRIAGQEWTAGDTVVVQMVFATGHRAFSQGNLLTSRRDLGTPTEHFGDVDEAYLWRRYATGDGPADVLEVNRGGSVAFLLVSPSGALSDAELGTLARTQRTLLPSDSDERSGAEQAGYVVGRLITLPLLIVAIVAITRRVRRRKVSREILGSLP